MNIRHDVANYYLATDEEKNTFWMKELNKPYITIGYEERVRMIHTSKLVEFYIAASELDRSILWSVYDQQTQMYCDRERFCKIFKLQQEIKSLSR